MKRTRNIACSLLLAGSLVAFTACSGDDDASGGDVLSAEDVSGADASANGESGEEAGAGGSTDSTVAEDEAVLDWTQCMRDNGIDIPDPTVDADGNVQLTPPTGGVQFDPQSDEFQAATEQCEDLLEGVTFGGGGAFDTLQDAFVEFTSCLRDEGLDVGDPDLGAGPGAGAGAGPDAGADPGDGLSAELLAQVVPGLDPDDPATQPAIDVCAPVLTEAFSGLGVGG